jgi:hypothetical protein
MTPDRFDSLLTVFARARSRRRVLARLVAAFAGGTIARDSAQAVGVTATVCLGRNERCKRKSECCSEHCHSRKSKKKRKCACSPRGAHCGASSDCCDSGSPLICVSGFCVPDR